MERLQKQRQDVELDEGAGYFAVFREIVLGVRVQSGSNQIRWNALARLMISEDGVADDNATGEIAWLERLGIPLATANNIVNIFSLVPCLFLVFSPPPFFFIFFFFLVTKHSVAKIERVLVDIVYTSWPFAVAHSPCDCRLAA